MQCAKVLVFLPVEACKMRYICRLAKEGSARNTTTRPRGGYNQRLTCSTVLYKTKAANALSMFPALQPQLSLTVLFLLQSISASFSSSSAWWRETLSGRILLLFAKLSRSLSLTLGYMLSPSSNILCQSYSIDLISVPYIAFQTKLWGFITFILIAITQPVVRRKTGWIFLCTWHYSKPMPLVQGEGVTTYGGIFEGWRV